MDFKKLQMDAVNPIEDNPLASGQEDISDIFSTPQSSKPQNADEKQIKEIPIDNIIPSKHNKFDRYTGEKKEAMIDSIKENGILSPLTLRKTDKPDIYEIISGENRWICAREAGKTTVPAYTLDCSEEDAIMYLTEANLINRDISFRERIIAYRQQYDVMKLKSGERSDLQNEGEKVDSLDILAKKYGESKTQMHRYIRTAELSDDLINAVGAKRISLDAAPKLTALDTNAQAVIANYLNENKVKINAHHADEIVKSFHVNSLNFTSLDDIFESEPQKFKPIKNISTQRFSRYFENVRDVEQIEETIEKALQMYFEHQESMTDEDEYDQIDEIE